MSVKEGEVRNQISEGLGKCEQRAKTLREDWKWQRGIKSNPLGEQVEEKAISRSRDGHREKYKAGECLLKASVTMSPPMAWEFRAGGVRAALLWCSSITTIRWGLLHGMCGTLDAELEEQRAIKRAESTAFFC